MVHVTSGAFTSSWQVPHKARQHVYVVSVPANASALYSTLSFLLSVTDIYCSLQKLRLQRLSGRKNLFTHNLLFYDVNYSVVCRVSLSGSHLLRRKSKCYIYSFQLIFCYLRTGQPPFLKVIREWTILRLFPGRRSFHSLSNPS